MPGLKTTCLRRIRQQLSVVMWMIVLISIMIAPDAVDLSPAHDGQKADEVGPRVIEDGNNDYGEDAQANRPIRIIHVVLSLKRPRFVFRTSVV